MNSVYINIISLGCSKNLVDSELLAGQLRANHIKVLYDAPFTKARTVIINTCGFIRDAKQESIDTILRAIKAKEDGKIDRVFVIGCLSERYKTDLKKEIPDVDKYFGINNITDIIKCLGLTFRRDLIGERQLHTPGHFAYLKISEGCDRKCAFCAIPLIRGSHVSRTIPGLMDESNRLAAQGVKELILIAQDLSSFGIDLNGKQQLPLLLEKLCQIDGIEWIRLHYAYPAGFPKDVIRVMKDNPSICRYLDIPFQHISNKMLRLMHRGNTKSSTLKLIDYFRKEIPGIALRTTLMVGHPGETEKEFDELETFVREVRFDRLGVFAYSHEEGTFGGNNYTDDIPEQVKQERLSRIMTLQREISAEQNSKLIGKNLRVLIDRAEGEYFIGRTEYDSPEVDNEVLISSQKQLKPGQFITACITGTEEYDLYGIES